MIIDCHVHPWAPTETILAAAQRNGIEQLCFFTLAANPEDFNGDQWWNPVPDKIRACNDKVINLTAVYPRKIHGLCFVNPNYPEHCVSEISRCITNGPMLGIKLWISARASSPPVFRVAELARQANVPILQHCWNKTTGNFEHETNTQDLAELAKAFPEVTIIAAHIHGHGERGILDLAPYPNVLLDTSGGEIDHGILEFALRRLGSKRILYGSDAPIRDFGPALARIEGCSMNEVERDDILYRNFERHFLKK